MNAAHGEYGLSAARRLSEDGVMADEPALLRALAADLAACEAVPAPPPRARPLRSADVAWGVAYALTGSALGGAMMLRSPSLAPSLVPSWPRAYLTAAAARAKRGEVRRTFAAMEAAGPAWDAAAEGALAVFARIYAVGAGSDPAAIEAQTRAGAAPKTAPKIIAPRAAPSLATAS